MNPAQADESQTRHQTWWKRKYVMYNIVMHILLIASNVATFVYVRHEKIPIAVDRVVWTRFVILYFSIGILGVLAWISVCKWTPDTTAKGNPADQLSHIMGLGFLIILFYSISPLLALLFGIPSSLWALSALLYSLYDACPDVS